MIKSFTEFINERDDSGRSRFSEYADDIIKCISDSNASDAHYNEIRELEYVDPYTFDLVIQLKRDSNPDFEKDSHFNDLSWEKINFEHYGFAIDASTKIDKADLIVPEIIFTIIIDPEREPDLYEELRYRLIDIAAHELNHTNQIGWNRKPFKVRPSSNKKRASSKKSHKYFLLPDEVESMVWGMYNRSKEQGVRIDKIFDKYLYPFLMNGNITKEEYNKVLKTWVLHTLENYPDANLSLEDEKIKQIVDQI